MGEPVTTRGHAGPIATDYTCLKCRRPLKVIGVRAELPDGREFTSFLAGQSYPGVKRGKPLRACPYCRHPMPTISWQRFREDGWPT